MADEREPLALGDAVIKLDGAPTELARCELEPVQIERAVASQWYGFTPGTIDRALSVNRHLAALCVVHQNAAYLYGVCLAEAGEANELDPDNPEHFARMKGLIEAAKLTPESMTAELARADRRALFKRRAPPLKN